MGYGTGPILTEDMLEEAQMILGRGNVKLSPKEWKRLKELWNEWLDGLSTVEEVFHNYHDKLYAKEIRKEVLGDRH